MRTTSIGEVREDLSYHAALANSHLFYYDSCVSSEAALATPSETILRQSYRVFSAWLLEPGTSTRSCGRNFCSTTLGQKNPKGERQDRKGPERTVVSPFRRIFYEDSIKCNSTLNRSRYPSTTPALLAKSNMYIMLNLLAFASLGMANGLSPSSVETRPIQEIYQSALRENRALRVSWGGDGMFSSKIYFLPRH